MRIAFLGAVIAQAILEPPPGRKLLGISLVSELEPIGRDPWKPSEPFWTFNERTGFNWSAYHLVQEIPRKIYAPFEYLDHTKTDAALYLTVVPATGWSAITESDLDELVKLCEDINTRGRNIFLRFAPEFNCPWHIWYFQNSCRGMQPIKFKRTWGLLSSKLRSRSAANKTALVWSAFEGNSYPFGDYDFSPRNNTDEYLALDTNRDGIIDSKDDPYSPFYPNDTFVDWVGLSIFWRGNDFPPRNNSRPPSNYISRIITGINTTNFYQTYATRLGKPMMIADTGAFFYRSTDLSQTPLPGVSELEMKYTWWSQLFNLAKEFPLIRMISISESRIINNIRNNNLFLDSRVANNQTILEAFQKAVRGLGDAVSWSVQSDMESWPAVDNAIPEVPKHDSGLQSMIILFILPVPIVTVVVWLMVAAYRQLRRPRPSDGDESGSKRSQLDPVDDGSTVFGSEIDSQITTSDDGLAFEDEFPDPYLLDLIVVSPSSQPLHE